MSGLQYGTATTNDDAYLPAEVGEEDGRHRCNQASGRTEDRHGSLVGRQIDVSCRLGPSSVPVDESIHIVTAKFRRIFGPGGNKVGLIKRKRTQRQGIAANLISMERTELR